MRVYHISLWKASAIPINNSQALIPQRVRTSERILLLAYLQGTQLQVHVLTKHWRHIALYDNFERPCKDRIQHPVFAWSLEVVNLASDMCALLSR